MISTREEDVALSEGDLPTLLCQSFQITLQCLEPTADINDLFGHILFMMMGKSTLGTEPTSLTIPIFRKVKGALFTQCDDKLRIEALPRWVDQKHVEWCVKDVVVGHHVGSFEWDILALADR